MQVGRREGAMLGFDVDAAAEVLDMLDTGTTTLADSYYELPNSSYTDPELHKLEIERIFHAAPLLAGLTAEVPNPGDWKTIDIAGVPLLITRGSRGEARALLNVCRHRGARLVDGRGSARRLTCPYHAWNYNTEGALIGVPRAEGFDGMCRTSRGLVPVPVAERDGLIWVIANSKAQAIDLDTHVGDLGAELALWQIEEWEYLDHVDHPVKANWKIVMDGFGENYHFKYLHKDTLGQRMIGTTFSHRGLGELHHRFVAPTESIRGLRDQPREQWRPFDDGHMVIVYMIWPNTLLLNWAGQCQFFQTFPTREVGSCVIRQTFLSHQPVREDDRPGLEEIFQLMCHVIRTEDIPVTQQQQDALHSGANDTIVFGRYELVLQQHHDAYRTHIGLEPLAKSSASSQP
jgi:phenylpropionate dioxygenase-like ring-hydroxylating dioxygenase large terminal subunit